MITADEVRDLSGREPRLMMKFDHSSQLPAVLFDHGRFILPLKNGLYAVIKGQGYHQPELCGEVIEFARQTRFDLKTTKTGLSEMQHLDIAFNTGLLGHFLGEPILYPTIRGRKRSPQFTFSVAGRELEVTGVQVEIDGGFEGRQSVTLVEAKIGESEDFHLRQLYYPVRFWSTQTQKKIRSVFFTYEPETELYRFREYRFDPPHVYQPPELVKAACYRITDAKAAVFQTLTRSNEFPFPQADRLDKVALIPFLVSEGHATPEKLAQVFEFSARQGRYYLDACRALRLLDGKGELTAEGSDYLTCAPELRYRLLCRAVLSLPVIQEIVSALLLSPVRRLYKREVETIVQRATSLSPATAMRRSQTVWSWLQWVAIYSPVIQVSSSEITLQNREKEPTREPAREQLKLF
jgi:Domain of unknown function (DUF6997)/Domain of unknown function (DUF6996)